MKKIVLSALLLATTVAFAQESKFSVSGSVDTYYSTNLSTGELGTTGILSDVDANGFGLGMANTIFAYESEKGGVVADLAFGPRANGANMYNGAINQLYAYYNASENVTLTLGQFNTFYGYEVISPAANFNYSVSYLFNAGPFSHTGLKIDIAASDDLSYMLAITNPMGLMEGSNSSSDDYQLGAQVGYKGHYLNAAYGADAIGYDMKKYNSPDDGTVQDWKKITEETIFVKDVLYLDYTGSFDLSESLYLGINAAYANSNDANYGYQGAALYLQKTVSDTFSLGLRPEFFQTTGSYTIEGSVPSEEDPNIFIDEETSISNETSVFALTLAGSTQLSDNLKLITEVRYDSSDEKDDEGKFTLPGGKDTVTGLTIAAVYSF